MKKQLIAALSLLLVAGTVLAGCKSCKVKRPQPTKKVVCKNGACARR